MRDESISGVTLQGLERVLYKGHRKQVTQHCVEQGSIVVLDCGAGNVPLAKVTGRIRLICLL